MVFPSLELPKTDSLSLSQISQKPLFIWLSDILNMFWHIPPNPERWMVFSSPELSKTDSLHLSAIFQKPPFIWLSGVLNMFWYMPPKSRKIDGFFESGVVQNRLFTSPAISREPLFIWLLATFEQILQNLERWTSFANTGVVKDRMRENVRFPLELRCDL